MDLRKIDKKLLSRLMIAVLAIIGIFVIIIIIKLIIGTRVNYENIEEKLVKAAENYYADNEDKLPSSNGSQVTISIDKLVEEKYIKELSKLVKDKDASCSAKVIVYKTNDYYLYEPELNCGDYHKTKYLKDVLTQDENIVTSRDGLYLINGDYVYRGEKVNNYVKFANKIWLILRINADGSIRLLDTNRYEGIEWDNRYNIDTKYNNGINNYELSRIKDYVDNMYKNTFKDKDKKFMIPQDICIGSRDEEETINDGSIECSKKLDNQILGLLQVNEYMLASIDQNCKYIYDGQCGNYNYLYNLDFAYWSITTDSNSTNGVYVFNPYPELKDAGNTASPNVTVHINSKVRYVSGDGTLKNPYTFK